MVLTNKWRSENNAPGAEGDETPGAEDEADNYMDVFNKVASETFEFEDMFETVASTTFMFEPLEDNVSSRSENSQTPKMVRGRSDESILQKIVAVPRRHNREHVSTIGLLSNSLKTNENQFNH